MNTEIRQIPPHATFAMRQAILRPHQRIEEMLYAGDTDPDTFHLGLYADGELGTIASFYRINSPLFSERAQYQLRGMATVATARGAGWGTAIVNAGILEASRRGAELLWCNAREVAIGFYETLGFVTIGEPFEIPGVGPHSVMFLKLNSQSAKQGN